MEPLDVSQALASLTNLSGNFTDFDYEAFLQDQDVNYLAEDNSSGSTTNVADPSPLSTSPPARTVGGNGSTQRQRMERRGHTKSRRGCYNCKRRRIKCQENRPSCGHCVKTGLKCEYPAAPQVIHQPQHQIPIFSLQDMRFFQHFLLNCVPHHPLGNESIWTHEIPCLSQNYEFLMHAILGFAASDLMAQEDPSLVTFAMTHRLKAIRAIKRTLSEVSKTSTFEEGNALMATCFALTFQSVMLDDGMAEYMTFCRGIVIVTVQMCEYTTSPLWRASGMILSHCLVPLSYHCKGSQFLFKNLLGENQMTVLRPFLEELPPINKDWADMAVAGIQALAPLCNHPVEKEYHGLILEMAVALHTSSVSSYQALCKHYSWWLQMPHDNFSYLIDPNNPICTLLASHWIALKQIMATITEMEHRCRAQEPSKKEANIDLGMIRWIRHLNRQVDPDHRQYNQWPVWVEAQLDQDITFFGKTRH